MSILSKIRIADVVDAAVEVSGLQHREILGTRRPKRQAYWRKLAYLAAYRLTGHSTTVVGRHFGRDHSTIVVMMRAVRDDLDRNPALLSDIARLSTRAVEIAEARGELRRAA